MILQLILAIALKASGTAIRTKQRVTAQSAVTLCLVLALRESSQNADIESISNKRFS